MEKKSKNEDGRGVCVWDGGELTVSSSIADVRTVQQGNSIEVTVHLKVCISQSTGDEIRRRRKRRRR